MKPIVTVKGDYETGYSVCVDKRTHEVGKGSVGQYLCEMIQNQGERLEHQSERILDLQVEVKRTWKERLFTRPWQPLKVMRTESYQVPDRDVLVDKHNRVIYAHPVVVKEIEAAIEKQHRL